MTDPILHPEEQLDENQINYVNKESLIQTIFNAIASPPTCTNNTTTPAKKN